MMRERRIGNLQFSLNVPNHQPLWMCRQKQLHDAQPRLCSHRREHIRILRHPFRSLLARAAFNISIFAEIWMIVKRMILAGNYPLRASSGGAGSRWSPRECISGRGLVKVRLEMLLFVRWRWLNDLVKCCPASRALFVSHQNYQCPSFKQKRFAALLRGSFDQYYVLLNSSVSVDF